MENHESGANYIERQISIRVKAELSTSNATDNEVLPKLFKQIC